MGLLGPNFDIKDTKMANKFTAIYNLTTKKWSISKELKVTNDSVFNFGFEKDGYDLIEFNGLEFGFKLWRTTGSIPDQVATRHYPYGKKQYLSSEKTILEVADSIKLSPGDDFRIDFYAVESGERSEISYEFTTHIPTQPYPSWLWDGTNWYAPSDRPIDSDVIDYTWNEQTTSWVSSSPDPDEALNYASE